MCGSGKGFGRGSAVGMQIVSGCHNFLGHTHTHTHSLSHWEDVFIALFIFHLHRTEELKELREHKSLDVARS